VATILPIECDLTSKGHGWSEDSTIHLLTVYLEAGRPFLGDPKQTAGQNFSTEKSDEHKCPVQALNSRVSAFPDPKR